jgi:Ni,Fe-hydrogenase I small subunit
MMENLGCKGTQARADCNIRAPERVGLVPDGGYPCINCTAPGFEEPGHALPTPKISGIPIGLPTDMPRPGSLRWPACRKPRRRVG